ncbi:uncharacterized protein LOC141907554 [Tubulanus polymorphus]|uniref:uncharacterized protein LOC141907554 n=1 Tax=Tubulanus polymorphus TaxID=672921 RepID=UPI003DA2FBA0
MRSETRRSVFYCAVILIAMIIISTYRNRNNRPNDRKKPIALPHYANGGKQVIFPDELEKPHLWAPLKTFEVVPRIVHYIWLAKEGTTFRFHNYISFLSAYKHLNPQRIILWCNTVPVGEYFDEMKRKVPVLRVKQITPPSVFSGRSVVVQEHQSEILRIQKIIEFGGVYLDTDIVVLKPFDELFRYDCTMPYYDSRRLNPGIIMAKPKSIFMELWLGELQMYFNDYKWDFHATFLPAQVAARNKLTIHIEYDTMDSPYWKDRKVLDDIYHKGVKFDWKSKYTFHLWHRFYKLPEPDPENIKTLDSSIGEIYRFIYYNSADLI